MGKVALVCAGGFCGTLARYVLMAPLLGLAGSLLPGGRTGFPYDIFVINLSGAFALAFLYGLVERGAGLAPDVRLAVGTGFLGAYTTFSTFVYGGDKLLASGAILTGILYLGGSLALGVGCVWAGTLAAAAVSMRSRMARGEGGRLRRRHSARNGTRATPSSRFLVPRQRHRDSWRPHSPSERTVSESHNDPAPSDGTADQHTHHAAREEKELPR